MNVIRYEPVFGDQSLFDGAPEDVVIAIKDVLSTKKVYYFSKNGWIKNNNGRRLHCDVHQIAMRRIEEAPEPKRWTVEDKKAGRLPDVGSKAVSVHGFCVVDILAVRNGCVVACNSDTSDARPCVFTIDNFLELYTPLESPEEKAARLRKEWCNEAVGVCSLGMTTLTRIYDALLSGDLPAPVKGE